MANEADIVFETKRPIPFTVADGTGIEKGALLKITDPMTAILNDTAGAPAAGIAASEKIASDGVTKLGVYDEGIFKVFLSGACTVGEPLCFDLATNYVKRATNLLSGARVLGHALETGADGETILMKLNVGVGGAPAAS